MRFNVVGGDPETGQSMELVVDATSLEEAAAVARRRNIHVMSVTPAEAAQVKAQPDRGPHRVTTRTEAVRPGRGLRKLVAVVLVVAFFAGFVAPAVPGVVGVALLGAITGFASLRGVRDRIRAALGVWPDKPVWGVVRLTFLAIYGVFLVGLAGAGFEGQKTSRQNAERQKALQAQRQQQQAEAEAQVRSIMAEAERALRQGDLAAARASAERASQVEGTSHAQDARQLLAKMDGAADPSYAIGLLLELSDDDFDGFTKNTTATLDIGFDPLNESVTRLARAHLAEAVTERASRESERVAKAEKERKEAEHMEAQRRAQEERKRAEIDAKVNGYPMGMTVQIGYTSYCVRQAKWSNRLSSNEYLNKRPNASYLFVQITVRNDDKKARTIPPFQLIDEHGAEYDSDAEAAVYREDAIGVLDDLNPGVNKTGVVVFDVPRNHTYKLKVDGGYWSSESAVIKIEPTE